MNYLCISDFEGTLIKKDGSISLNTINIINEFINNNKFIIISESSINELFNFINKYNLNVDIASVSDGIIYINNKEIKNELEAKIINNIINKFNEDIYTAYTNDIIYNYQERLINLYPKDYKISNLFNSSSYINIVININKNDDFLDFLNNNNLSYRLIGKDKNRAFYNIKKSFNNKLDIYNYVINYYKNYKTIGISDSYNDIDLLNKCDIAYAMKNSDELLKNNIKNITLDTNEKDGVATTLNDICHLK